MLPTPAVRVTLPRMGGGKVCYLDVSGTRSRHARWGDVWKSLLYSLFIGVAALMAVGASGLVALNDEASEWTMSVVMLVGAFGLPTLIYSRRRSDIWRHMRRAFIEPYGLSLFDTWRTIKPLRRSGGQIWGTGNLLIAFVALGFTLNAVEQSGNGYLQSPVVWLGWAIVAVLVLNAVRLFTASGDMFTYAWNTIRKIVQVVVSLAAVLLVLRLIFIDHAWLSILAEQSGVSNLDSTAQAGLGVAFLVGVIALLWYMRKRLQEWDDAETVRLGSAVRASAKHAEKHDARAPIIYLRAFNDDGLYFQTNNVGVTGNTQRSIDEVIAQELRLLGPFIAIGKPGELRPAGAARAYYSDGQWQGAVQELMDRAQMIVAVASWTPGLQWELGALVQRGYLPKTIFVIPPSKHRDARIDWLRHAVAGTRFGELLQQADLSHARVVHMAGDNLLVTIGHGEISDFELGMITATYANRVLKIP